MKIYINTDLEGVCGVFSKEHLFPGERLYPEARKLLSQEVDAAVKGAFDGGADEVIVLDGHGGACHFLINEMDERAQYIQGSGRNQWLPNLAGSDGIFLIGVHAKAGTEGAVLDHTQSLEGVRSIKVNKIEIGEIGQVALIAGAWGIPVVLVSGDDKACAEAQSLIPQIEQVIVKKAISRYSAMHLHPQKACTLIFEAAKRAVSLCKAIKPYSIPGPYSATIELATTDIAQGTLAYIPRQCEYHFLNSRTIEFKADDIRKLFP